MRISITQMKKVVVVAFTVSFLALVAVFQTASQAASTRHAATDTAIDNLIDAPPDDRAMLHRASPFVKGCQPRNAGRASLAPMAVAFMRHGQPSNGRAKRWQAPGPHPIWSVAE